MSREQFGRVQGEAGDAVLEEKLRGGARTKEDEEYFVRERFALLVKREA